MPLLPDALASFALATESNAAGEAVCRSARNKKYFATFKGRIYEKGKPGDIRLDLLRFHNDSDIVIAPLRHRQELYDQSILALFERGIRYSYLDLMNTVFAIVPGGRQPATYRLIECLSAGVVPIIYENPSRLVLPFQDVIPWSKISLVADSSAPGSLGNALEYAAGICRDDLDSMIFMGRDIYRKYFESHERVAGVLLSLYF